MNKFFILGLVSSIILAAASGCDKFLAEKSDKKLVIPNSLDDFQALIDNVQITNAGYSSEAEASADNYYFSYPVYLARTDAIQRMHRWEPDRLFPTTSNNSWFSSYQSINVFNTVLAGLDLMEQREMDQSKFNSVYGQALVLRAYRFLDLAGVFCLAYDDKASDMDLGLPLRLDPDFNKPSSRASVNKTYTRIIDDLKASIPLLPVNTINAYRAGRPLAYALLARTYLNMRKYKEAGIYADSCLQLRNELLDYRELDPKKAFPVPALNREVIFQAIFSASSLGVSYTRVPSSIYEMYKEGDLRREIYFNFSGQDTLPSFKGNYTERTTFAGGPTTGEMYLIYAESMARQGRLEETLYALNTLREMRYTDGSFEPFMDQDSDRLLEMVLEERRKELLFRGLRWMDIKRLNKEGTNIQLWRVWPEETHVLPPNDLRYALPIPEQVISLSGIPQNPR